MRDLPSGTVTFLFTDIEGSTRLLQELGDGYAAALAEHRDVLRAAFTAHGGVEVDTQGDAFFAAFARASDAVSAAVAIQHELAPGPIRVRVGLHTGEPLLTDEGYVGLDLHRGARVCAAGHGGQVLLSQPTRDLVDVDAATWASIASRISSSRNGSTSSARRNSRRSRRWTGRTCRCRPRRSSAASES